MRLLAPTRMRTLEINKWMHMEVSRVYSSTQARLVIKEHLPYYPTRRRKDINCVVNGVLSTTCSVRSVQRKIVGPPTKKQPRVRYVHNAERHFRTRERRGPSQGIIQKGARNDRNPNAATHEDLHQQWTQHAEEQARVAARELHNIKYKIRGTYQEKKDTFLNQRVLPELSP